MGTPIPAGRHDRPWQALERAARFSKKANSVTNEPGTIAILSVGDGDTKISFDPKSPAERARAGRLVSDMLRRGYALLVQVGEQGGEPIYRRAKRFDPETYEYIVAFDPPEGPDEQQSAEVGEQTPAQADGGAAAPRRRWRPRSKAVSERRVPASHARAVAVSRSAGG